MTERFGAEEPLEVEDQARLDTLLRDMAPAVELPAGLRERTLAAIAADAAPPVRPIARAPWWRKPRFALGGMVALAVAVLAVVLVLGTRGPSALELRAELVSPGEPRVTAQVDVTKTGIGRVVELDTDELPILPKGEYYELWFVGPGDRAGRPNRVSAGTFHPDPQGRSRVTFAAAVEPAKYPVVSVTAEPGDGDPRPSAVEVLRSR